MTPRTDDAAPPTLRQRRRDRTRQEIAVAVLDVIAVGGDSAATIDRVVAASGVARGTVYAHFPGGRDELLRAAYAELGARVVERTRAAVDDAGSWTERIAAHAAPLFALAADTHLGHFYNVSGPAIVHGGPERGIGSGASAGMISETLEAAREAGAVPADTDAHVVAALLVGALREAAIGVASGALDPDRAAAAFAALVSGIARAAESRD